MTISAFEPDHREIASYLRGYADAVTDIECAVDARVDVLVEMLRGLYPRDWRRETLEYRLLQLTRLRHHPAPGDTAGTDPASHQEESE